MDDSNSLDVLIDCVRESPAGVNHTLPEPPKLKPKPKAKTVLPPMFKPSFILSDSESQGDNVFPLDNGGENSTASVLPKDKNECLSVLSKNKIECVKNESEQSIKLEKEKTDIGFVKEQHIQPDENERKLSVKIESVKYESKQPAKLEDLETKIESVNVKEENFRQDHNKRKLSTDHGLEESRLDHKKVKEEVVVAQPEAQKMKDEVVSVIPNRYLEHVVVSDSEDDDELILAPHPWKTKEQLENEQQRKEHTRGKQPMIITDLDLDDFKVSENEFLEMSKRLELERLETETVDDDPTEVQAQDETVNRKVFQSLNGSNGNKITAKAVETPFQMRVSLLPHQKKALGWMIDQENRRDEPRGGILADDQGLGKTLTTLALIMTNIPRMPDSNVAAPLRTLVVVPMSLINQWANEIETKIENGFKPSVYIYYGKNRKTIDVKSLAREDIVITTYATVTMEHINAEGLLFKIRWRRLILDEAHSIRNRRSVTYDACCLLQACHRWCLTGTPIQNTVDDMFALFCFLRFSKLLMTYADWRREYKSKIESPRSTIREDALKKFFVLRNYVLLRRSKTDQMDGKPILELPERIVTIKQKPFSEEERRYYMTVKGDYGKKFKEMDRQGVVMNRYMYILVLITRLRQLCDHPHLVERVLKYTMEEVMQTLEDIRKNGGILNLLVDDVKFRVMEAFKNLLEENASEKITESDCPVCYAEIGKEGVVTRCGHFFCRPCLEQWQRNDNNTCPFCRNSLGENMNLAMFPISEIQKEIVAIEMGKNPEKVKDIVIPKEEVITALPKERDWRRSTKIKMLIEEIEEMTEEDPAEKALVFSQWVSMLDLIEDALRDNNISFARLDGTMSIRERNEAVLKFENSSNARIFLISLRAGGCGLDLKRASRVIIVDFWWNPALENQAIDRCHRIGQTRPVKVVRLKIEDSIEDDILELQTKKEAIFEDCLEQSSAVLRNRNRLTLKDLRKLFRMTVPENMAESSTSNVL